MLKTTKLTEAEMRQFAEADSRKQGQLSFVDLSEAKGMLLISHIMIMGRRKSEWFLSIRDTQTAQD